MDIKEIKALADSVKISYTEEDLLYWQSALDQVDVWEKELAGLDTSGQNMKFANSLMPMRDDIPSSYPDPGSLVASFKETEDNMAKVKKVL